MQFHSLAVGHRKGCDETVFHKMCNVTHKLLVTGKDVMRVMRLTAFNKMCNIAHMLLVIGGKYVHRMAFQKYWQCYSHTVMGKY